MESFSADLQPLTSDHRVIFYDQRGGGRSGLPEDESRLGATWFVEDLEAVRRHFQLERMNLVAHSFGAVLVARYAQEHPGRVGRIALLGATGPRRAAAAPKPPQEEPSREEAALQAEMREILGTLLQGTAEDPVAACRRYEALGKRLADLAGEPSGWQGSSCEAPPEAVAYYFSRTAQITPRSFGDWDFTGNLGAVSAPVLVISGDRQSAAPEQQREWAAAYPNGRLLVVPGAGKAAVATHPEVVVPALAEFFATRTPATRPARRAPRTGPPAGC